MSHSLTDCHAGVLAALRTVVLPGADLSVPGAVDAGRYARPPIPPPFVAVSAPVVDGRPGPALTQWSRGVTIDVVAWLPAATPTAEGRIETGLAAIDALMGALDQAHLTRASPLYGVPDFVVSGAAVDSDLDTSPSGYTVVGLVVEFTLLRRRGTG